MQEDKKWKQNEMAQLWQVTVVLGGLQILPNALKVYCCLPFQEGVELHGKAAFLVIFVYFHDLNWLGVGNSQIILRVIAQDDNDWHEISRILGVETKILKNKWLVMVKPQVKNSPWTQEEDQIL